MSSIKTMVVLALFNQIYYHEQAYLNRAVCENTLPCSLLILLNYGQMQFHVQFYFDRLNYQIVQTGGRSVIQLRTRAMPPIDDATTRHTKASPYTVLDLSIYIIAPITPVHICTSVVEHIAYQPECYVMAIQIALTVMMKCSVLVSTVLVCCAAVMTTSVFIPPTSVMESFTVRCLWITRSSAT